jgi:SAM-dependent methyltransferase
VPKHEYAIRGGLPGRERLRVVARVMRPAALQALERVGFASGMSCLDAGSGGGDLVMDLAELAAPEGDVLGIDIDATKVELAREEARQRGLANVRFEVAGVLEYPARGAFDLVHARFLLTHLKEPGPAALHLVRCARPGGTILLEDIDFTSYFTWPDSSAFERYRELYVAVVERRGGDPCIGPRLPSLLRQAGCRQIGVQAVQPIALEGDAKLINPLTLENIADVVLEDGLATAAEIARLVEELYAFAADPATIAGTPRVIQAWGVRPGDATLRTANPRNDS